MVSVWLVESEKLNGEICVPEKSGIKSVACNSVTEFDPSVPCLPVNLKLK